MVGMKTPAARTRKAAQTKSTAPSMSDASVLRATGQNWADWFRRLDKAGAATLDHKAIVKTLGERHSVTSWWRQMITVEYERARGLRMKHEKSDGTFTASASKAINAPVEKLFAAWTDAKKRTKWLPHATMQIRIGTANKSLSARWGPGPSKLTVGFLAKAPGKSLVQLDHNALPDLAAVGKIKTYWRAALERLKALLNRGTRKGLAAHALSRTN